MDMYLCQALFCMFKQLFDLQLPANGIPLLSNVTCGDLQCWTNVYIARLSVMNN